MKNRERIKQNLSLPSRDPQRVKYEHRELHQYQAGAEIVTLINRSISNAYGDSDTTGGTEGLSFGRKEDTNYSEGQDKARTDTTGTNESGTVTDGTTRTDQSAESEMLICDAFDSARRRVRGSADGTSRSDAQTAGTSESTALQTSLHTSRGGSSGTHFDRSLQTNWNRSRVTNYGETTSYTQQIVPIYAWREVVRVELMPLEEQDKMKETEIARQGTGEAFFYVKGQSILQGHVQMTRDWLLDTPDFAARQIAEFLKDMFRAPFYRMGQAILAERAKVIELVIAQLESRRSRLPAPNVGGSSPELVVDDFALNTMRAKQIQKPDAPDGYTHTL